MKLINPIRRETFTKVPLGKYRGRALMIELQPGDILQFRIKGTQQRTDISLAACYAISQKISFEKEYKKRIEQYQADRKAGKKVRKPKRPNLYLSKTYTS